MAENADLNIVIKVTDQGTGPAKKALSDVGNEGEKASKKTQSGFLQARKAVQDFHKEMFIVGLAFGAVATAMNEWAKRNDETRQAMNELALATSNVTAKVGKFVEEHTALGWAFIIASHGAKEYNNSINDEFTQVSRATEGIKKFNDDLTQQKILFIEGKTSVFEYYAALQTGAQNQIALNQQAAQSLQQMAQLTAEVHNKELMDARNKTNEQINLLKFYQDTHATSMQGMAAFTVTLGKAIQTNVSGALTSMITGAKTAKEAFADLGKAMLTAIVDFMVQKVVAWVLEKTLLAGTVAASVGAAATIAAAWAPAATLVSAATFGASAVAGMAALSALFAVSQTMAASSLTGGAGGGATAGARIGTSDGAGGATTWGPVVPRARGGDDFVTKPTLFLAGEAGPERVRVDPQGSRGFNGGGEGITINIFAGNIGSNDDIRKLTEALGFEVDRSLRLARG